MLRPSDFTFDSNTINKNYSHFPYSNYLLFSPKCFSTSFSVNTETFETLLDVVHVLRE